MNDNTPKKEKRHVRRKTPKIRETDGPIITTKRQPKRQIDDLAAAIFATNEEDNASTLDLQEDNASTPPSNGDIPWDAPEEEIVPERIQLEHGTSKANAVVVNRSPHEITAFLNKHFGSEIGAYFIATENTMTSYNTQKQRRRYKCISVEDKYGFRYALWFDLSKLGPVY